MTSWRSLSPGPGSRWGWVSGTLRAGAGVRGDKSGADPTLSLEPGQGGIHSSFEHIGQAQFVQPLDHLVAVGLALGEESQQEQRQDALEQLRIVETAVTQ